MRDPLGEVASAVPGVECTIIGGGFAGLHCAVKLAESGFRVLVVEAADRLMTGATLHNMARIHLGFRYPGSIETAMACIPAAFEFVDEFSDVIVRERPGTDGGPARGSAPSWRARSPTRSSPGAQRTRHPRAVLRAAGAYRVEFGPGTGRGAGGRPFPGADGRSPSAHRADRGWGGSAPVDHGAHRLPDRGGRA